MNKSPSGEIPAKVSVVILAYNQEEFIKETIQSILQQKTNFPFVIKISDNCSTDQTGEICQQLAKTYPQKIKYLRRAENIGAERNFMESILSVDTEYLSYCDGDDLWLDNNKLQNQISFLDNNRSYAAICSDCQVTDANRRPKGLFSKGRITEGKEEMDITIRDFLKSLYRPIHISSITVRSKEAKECFPEWFPNAPILDTPFLIPLTGKFRVKYTGEVTAIYRHHEKSFTRSHENREKQLEKLIQMFEALDNFFDLRFHSEFKLAINNRKYHFHQKEYLLQSGFLSKIKHGVKMIFHTFSSSLSFRDTFYILRQKK